MNLKNRLTAFEKLGELLKEFTNSYYDDDSSGFQKMLGSACIANQWFTKENQLLALKAIATMLEKENLAAWTSRYENLRHENATTKTVGFILAGNIPAVGFHDLLCALIAGHSVKAKCSTDDKILLPWIFNLLMEVDESFQQKIMFVDKLTGIDAVIATGSDNSARYFDYYFGKYPHIIRKNRNAVAVLTGNETGEELQRLGKDIFSYFGLGCRNVSKMYVPRTYSFDFFFECMQSFAGVMQHNKYMNNHDYHSAIFLMNNIKFLTNNFLIIKEDAPIATPVSVLNFEYYDNIQVLQKELATQKEKIQCVVANTGNIKNAVAFGETQQPQLWDYADGVDTLAFLLNIE